MSYKSILVNIDIDRPIAPIVKTAADLARRNEARLIGLCAAEAPMPMVVPDGGAIVGQVWQQLRDDIERRFKEVHAEFDRLTAGSVRAEWRQRVAGPVAALVEASRSGDLIVMADSRGSAIRDSNRLADPASVVLRAGRPVLVTGEKVEQLKAEKIIVAWKDTREARRAVADAVPLLAAARSVTVVTVTDEADRWVRDGLNDVIAFLSAHKIEAMPKLIESPGENVELFNFIEGGGADLVVSGAYGHSRLREWAFGGVTRSLLDKTGLNRFMSS